MSVPRHPGRAAEPLDLVARSAPPSSATLRPRPPTSWWRRFELSAGVFEREGVHRLGLSFHQGRSSHPHVVLLQGPQLSFWVPVRRWQHDALTRPWHALVRSCGSSRPRGIPQLAILVCVGTQAVTARSPSPALADDPGAEVARRGVRQPADLAEVGESTQLVPSRLNPFEGELRDLIPRVEAGFSHHIPGFHQFRHKDFPNDRQRGSRELVVIDCTIRSYDDSNDLGGHHPVLLAANKELVDQPGGGHGSTCTLRSLPSGSRTSIAGPPDRESIRTPIVVPSGRRTNVPG